MIKLERWFHSLTFEEHERWKCLVGWEELKSLKRPHPYTTYAGNRYCHCTEEEFDINCYRPRTGTLAQCEQLRAAAVRRELEHEAELAALDPYFDHQLGGDTGGGL